MDFDILDVINDATKEADAFEGHPVAELDLEQQLLYLNGLALVMNADGHIDDSEKEYIRILIKSIGMDESLLDDMVNFAKKPDKDTVQAFFRTYRRRPISQLFLFDALMMTRRDGKVEDKEMLVVNKIADQLEILKGTQQDIFDLFCHINNRNWQESALYFSSHLLNSEHFKHLLKYHEVDFDELIERTESFRQSRLIEILKSRLDVEIEWGSFACAGSSQYAEYITTKPISISNTISNAIILPWLQFMLDRGKIRATPDKLLLIINDSEVEISTLKSSPFKYDSENVCIYIDDVAVLNETVESEILITEFIAQNNLNNLNSLLELVGAKDVAVGLSNGQFPTCNGKEINALKNIGDGKNAVIKIETDKVTIGYALFTIRHGIPFVQSILEELEIPMSEMLTTHGFYLVK